MTAQTIDATTHPSARHRGGIDRGEGLTGTVLRMERASVFDGDGFRTVVFLKGCPLRCAWCSTPESQSCQIEYADGAVYGTPMTVEEVMREVRKDSVSFFLSGGGLTISGGEALIQPAFTRELLRAAHEECIDTAIETSFFAAWEIIEELLPYLNTAFVDMKAWDSGLHRRLTGVGNGTIRENLLKTNAFEGDLKLRVRVPVIPGVNDADEEIRGIAAFCAGLDKLEYLQLLPYHRLGVDTYRKLGRVYGLPDLAAPSAAHMEGKRAIAREFVADVR